MRITEELIAAWRDVASATIRACVEETSARLREQAEGYGMGGSALRLETNGKKWSPDPQLVAYCALLPELAALGNDAEVAFGLIGEIADAPVRDLVAAEYITVLAGLGLLERARTARNYLEFAHPQMRYKAFLVIAAATDDADDYLKALEAAEAIVDDGVRFKAVLEALWTVVHIYLSEGKSKMSKATLKRIVDSEMLAKFPYWKECAGRLLEGDR
jgi:hypothetical protein